MYSKEDVAISVGILKDEDFFTDRNISIFRAIKAIFSNGLNVDLVSVTEELRTIGKLDAVGGAYYLSTLSAHIGAGNIEHHCYILKEYSMRRETIRVSMDAMVKAYDITSDVIDAHSEWMQNVYAVGDHSSGSEAVHVSSFLQRSMDMIEARTNEPIQGIPSGLAELDWITGGWADGNLVIIAARPSTGKTALAMTLARAAAGLTRTIKPGYKPVGVALFELEMSEEQMGERLLAQEANVNSRHATKGRDMSKLVAARDKLGASPLFVDTTPGISVSDIRSKVMRLRLKMEGFGTELGLIIIDYLGLIRASDRYRGNRNLELGEISGDLKKLAKELSVPIIALHQLNRSADTRSDGRPKMSDLRESGRLEEDADDIVLIWRPLRNGVEYYEPENRPGLSTKGIAILDVVKQRMGPTKEAIVAFTDETASFENMALDAHLALPRDTYDEGADIF